ncbi:hypothetical protein EMPS_04813 [Entomortierella parvispora]|uniref:Pentacotripeptide-repeat region of PRORP domain-containing protein n=1 Tax=Entomortierella parvispora TaxID=205924 RepID=A0A9P3H940_9FUNG|nr:hypothetical protein EMPS_04813 [Entomortierella parvispora]
MSLPGMRPNSIRHVLTGSAPQRNASAAMNQIQSSFPDFWQKCFQRAFARSFHSRPPRIHHCGVLMSRAPPPPTSTSLVGDSAGRTRHLEGPAQQHQLKRAYGQQAALVLKRSSKGPHSARLQSTPDPTSPIVSQGLDKKPPEVHVAGGGKMGELQSAIKRRDLQTAYKYYQELRSRGAFSTSNPNLCHPRNYLFRTLCRLAQLIHKARLELTAKPSSVPASQHNHTKQLQKLEAQRRQVLKDIEPYFEKESPATGYLTVSQRRLALVDAMAESQANIEFSFSTGSETYLKDRREALKVLEDWALATAEPKKIFATPTGVAYSESITAILEQDLIRGITKLMRLLVHSHTFLVKSMLETIPENFGIPTTVSMHVALLRYYSMFGRDGYRDTMSIFTQMDQTPNLNWRQEPVLYDYLMYALSHLPGNEPKAEMLIQGMLSRDIAPRATTMKAAILCAARSGDLEACSRYIARMQQDWNLSLSERMKAILLYACAKRGDFDGALEIMEQLDHSGKLVQDKLKRNGPSNHRLSTNCSRRKIRSGKSNDSPVQATGGDNGSITAPTIDTERSRFITPKMQDILSSDDIINNSNILLALINQTRTRRERMNKTSSEISPKQSQAFLKEEVSKVLELFTLITKDPKQTDTQLYTIMMQYLSTLPSPLPGMMYLYRDMQASERTKPNAITYRILLEACAEQMDMEQGRELWEQMKNDNIPAFGFVRASYVKGWGRAGYLQTAEWFAREGLALQRAAEKENEVLWWKMKHENDGGSRRLGRRERALFMSSSALTTGYRQYEHGQQPQQPQQHQALQVPEIINLTVLHELMRANRLHNRPKRVVNIFKQIDAGKWGIKIRPNQHTLSIVLQACSSPVADSQCVDQAIDLVERFLKKLKDRLEPRRHIPRLQPLLSSLPSSPSHERNGANIKLELEDFLSTPVIEDHSKTKSAETIDREPIPRSSSVWSSWWTSSERTNKDDRDIEPDFHDTNSRDGYAAVDMGDDDDMDGEDNGSSDVFGLPTIGTEPSSSHHAGSIPCLSAENYECYLAMLAQHHRQEKMVEVWDAMMAAYASMDLTHGIRDADSYDFTSIASKHEHRYRGPPRVQTVNILVEALENVQWGVQPIRKIQRDLETFWPDQDWSLAGRMRRVGGVSGSQSAGALENSPGRSGNDLLRTGLSHSDSDSLTTSSEGTASAGSGFGGPRQRSDRHYLDEDEDDFENGDGFLATGAGGRFWK